MSAAALVKPQIQIKLTVLSGPHTGQSFVMSKASFTIGRGPENEIILINDSKISRQHAKIQIIGQDVEIFNLSQKNQVFVGAESVQKWKLVNESTFKIGESEFRIDFDLGQAVVPVQTGRAVSVVPLGSQQPLKTQVISPNISKPTLKKEVTALANGAVATKAVQSMNAMQKQMPSVANLHSQHYQGLAGAPDLKHSTIQSGDKLNNPKVRFYLIFGFVLVAVIYWLNDTPKKSSKNEIKSTLKYEDDFLIKQNSAAEKELDLKRKKLVEQKNSPTYLRLQENFQKGMRDFNLGNYSRAIDFFQVVLNLDPTHSMAKRQMYLAKARFDEVLKSKLMLGESYYQKHNFKMCEAMYQQVLTMLQGKSNDRSYQLAQSMVEKCRLASEGIR